MSKWEGLDRRKFPRVNYPCLVVLRNDSAEADVLLTHTENIGIGGVCVILKKDLKMFTPVEVELDLLDLGNHIKCKGKVVWNVKRGSDVKKKPLFYDVGIEFETLDDGEQQRLEEIVKRLVKSNQGTPYA
ncbi:MAG: PilZ domain-containing protein [Candidatus Omnitrophica bacterium]|nr:PilZ domain-containing protein [Candidatus Omnitrophota bacterium]